MRRHYKALEDLSSSSMTAEQAALVIGNILSLNFEHSDYPLSLTEHEILHIKHNLNLALAYIKQAIESTLKVGGTQYEADAENVRKRLGKFLLQAIQISFKTAYFGLNLNDQDLIEKASDLVTFIQTQYTENKFEVFEWRNFKFLFYEKYCELILKLHSEEISIEEFFASYRRLLAIAANFIITYPKDRIKDVHFEECIRHFSSVDYTLRLLSMPANSDMYVIGSNEERLLLDSLNIDSNLPAQLRLEQRVYEVLRKNGVYDLASQLDFISAAVKYLEEEEDIASGKDIKNRDDILKVLKYILNMHKSSTIPNPRLIHREPIEKLILYFAKNPSEES